MPSDSEQLKIHIMQIPTIFGSKKCTWRLELLLVQFSDQHSAEQSAWFINIFFSEPHIINITLFQNNTRVCCDANSSYYYNLSCLKDPHPLSLSLYTLKFTHTHTHTHTHPHTQTEFNLCDKQNFYTYLKNNGDHWIQKYTFWARKGEKKG